MSQYNPKVAVGLLGLASKAKTGRGNHQMRSLDFMVIKSLLVFFKDGANLTDENC